MDPQVVLWVALAVLVLGMLALDLFVFHRTAHEVPVREAALFSGVWIGIGLAFGALVFVLLGAEAGGEYLAGYVIEKSLSIDNVFVFAMIFGYFAVPAKYQHRLLFWGVFGAIVFRAVFIAAGAALLEAFHPAIYVFGVLLLLTGWRMWRSRDEHALDLDGNRLLRVVSRLLPTTQGYRGERFFVREGGRWIATPLVAVLVAIETSDIMFAIDSIPAVFAVTHDAFIVFSSNAFAILGLRSLYFLLSDMLGRFAYLKAGLSALLVFAGAKILLALVWEMPVWLSLAAVVAILGTSVAASARVGRGSVRAVRATADATQHRPVP